MLDLVEKDEIPAGKIVGGSILEVGKDQRRLVYERNDPGPTGPGNTVAGNAKAIVQILDEVFRKGWGALGGK